MNQKKNAFTLVELIVVIAILAILSTVAFISIQNYALDARNSARVSDINTLRSALSFFGTEKGYFPTPDNYETFSYSGVVLMKQGVFGEKARGELRKISTNIFDPVLNTELDYSLLSTRPEYQISTNYELYASADSYFLDTAYANDNSRFQTYIVGTYDSYDVNASTGSSCSLITLPSLLLSEIPSSGELTLNAPYKFSYHKGPNLSKNAYEATDKSSAGLPFTVEEVYNSCTLDTVEELDLYIAKLSTAYQQYSDSSVYENIVFTSDTKKFRSRTAVQLQENRIEIAPELLELLDAPIPDDVFSEDFTNTDGTLAISHVNPSGAWNINTGSPNSYSIFGNELQKIDNSFSLLSPSPTPAVTSPNTDVRFEITNFAGGNIKTYLRYQDSNTYYAAEISPTGYKLIRMLGGTEAIIQSINEPISTPVMLEFSSRADTLKLSIGGIEKENLNISGVDGVGGSLLLLENSGSSIDNYSLTYR